MFQQTVDGQQFQLKQPHDFVFLARLGRVFCVYDRLISGFLGFGLARADGRRIFVKYAGAQPTQYAGTPEDAVARLRQAAGHYDALAHPALNRKIAQFETLDGFGLVFEWFDGIPLAPLAEYFQRMRQMPLLQRCKMYDAFVDLNRLAEENTLIPSGLADAHFMVDFRDGTFMQTSVDQYVNAHDYSPARHLHGSPWYLAPEAYHPTGPMDETTAVYAMGAVAFSFFGCRYAGERAGWDAGDALYAVAAKATQTNRAQRYQSVAAYQQAWRQAILISPIS